MAKERIIQEAVGIAGTVFILVSMVIPSTGTKKNILMRVLNNIGSVLIIVYGFQIGAVSTIILNVVVFLVNLFHIIKMVRR